MQKMSTERYDAYRKAAQTSVSLDDSQVMAQLAIAEATLLVAEQLEEIKEVMSGEHIFPADKT